MRSQVARLFFSAWTKFPGELRGGMQCHTVTPSRLSVWTQRGATYHKSSNTRWDGGLWDVG